MSNLRALALCVQSSSLMLINIIRHSCIHSLFKSFDFQYRTESSDAIGFELLCTTLLTSIILFIELYIRA